MTHNVRMTGKNERASPLLFMCLSAEKIYLVRSYKVHETIVSRVLIEK